MDKWMERERVMKEEGNRNKEVISQIMKKQRQKEREYRAQIYEQSIKV